MITSNQEIFYLPVLIPHTGVRNYYNDVYAYSTFDRKKHPLEITGRNFRCWGLNSETELNHTNFGQRNYLLLDSQEKANSIVLNYLEEHHLKDDFTCKILEFTKEQLVGFEYVIES